MGNEPASIASYFQTLVETDSMSLVLSFSRKSMTNPAQRSNIISGPSNEKRSKGVERDKLVPRCPIICPGNGNFQLSTAVDQQIRVPAILWLVFFKSIEL